MSTSTQGDCPSVRESRRCRFAIGEMAHPPLHGIGNRTGGGAQGPPVECWSDGPSNRRYRDGERGCGRYAKPPRLQSHSRLEHRGLVGLSGCTERGLAIDRNSPSATPVKSLPSESRMPNIPQVLEAFRGKDPRLDQEAFSEFSWIDWGGLPRIVPTEALAFRGKPASYPHRGQSIRWKPCFAS